MGVQSTNLIQCSHLESGERQKPWPHTIPMGNDKFLVVCEQCGAQVEAAVLRDVLVEGTREAVRRSIPLGWKP